MAGTTRACLATWHCTVGHAAADIGLAEVEAVLRPAGFDRALWLFADGLSHTQVVAAGPGLQPRSRRSCSSRAARDRS